MSITGDMVIDYEMATPDEFLEFYQQQYDDSAPEEMVEKDVFRRKYIF